MNKKIGEIQKELEQATGIERARLCEEYASDLRTGVQKLLLKYRRQEERLRLERERLDGMRLYERKYADCTWICGIDEAGRGPLAGPVVAGAVILPKDCEILYLNDSKKLSPKRREMLYEEIMEKAIASGIGMASPERIDEINILQATYEAMREAVGKLGIVPDILLNDAVKIPQVSIRQVPIIKGDEKSVSIAAASILAKVTRDHLMIAYDEQYPEYGFASHKGYGSAFHMESRTIPFMGSKPIFRILFVIGYH